MALEKWEYKICDCRVRVTKKRFLRGPIDGYWTLTVDGIENGLNETIADLGMQGWELAGIQTAQTSHLYGQYNRVTNYAHSFYVFKRSLGAF